MEARHSLLAAKSKQKLKFAPASLVAVLHQACAVVHARISQPFVVQMWELTIMGNIGIRIAPTVGILNLGVIYVRNAGQTRNGQATLRGGVVRYAKHGSPVRVQCMLGSSSVSAGSFRACLQIFRNMIILRAAAAAEAAQNNV